MREELAGSKEMMPVGPATSANGFFGFVSSAVFLSADSAHSLLQYRVFGRHSSLSSGISFPHSAHVFWFALVVMCVLLFLPN